MTSASTQISCNTLDNPVIAIVGRVAVIASATDYDDSSCFSLLTFVNSGKGDVFIMAPPLIPIIGIGPGSSVSLDPVTPNNLSSVEIEVQINEEGAKHLLTLGLKRVEAVLGATQMQIVKAEPKTLTE